MNQSDVEAKIIQLRSVLSERFGSQAFQTDFSQSPKLPVYSTDLTVLDEIGIPEASLTELVSPATAGPRGGLLLYGILQTTLARGERVMLIDGRSSFSPTSLSETVLPRLLWVQCQSAGDAVKTADLAVRDGHLPLVLLLLVLNAASELRRIPATGWQRLQLLAEKSGVTVLAFTPKAQIGCARLRLNVGGAFPLHRIQKGREEALATLPLHVERRRWSERSPDETVRRSICA